MKNIAIGILMVVLLSVLVEPLVEIANVMREKIIIGAALSNSCRAAKERSLNQQKQRDMDAEIDMDVFVEYFSEAFESAMNVTMETTSGNTIVFRPNGNNYNKFTVTLDVTVDTDVVTEKNSTKINVKAETPYKFKTKYLKIVEDSGGDGYDLTSERMLLLKVTN